MPTKDKAYEWVKQRVRDMYTYRQTDTQVFEDGWEKHWDWARKKYLMWSRSVFDELGRERSNMKSPLLAGVIEAVMAETVSQNYRLHFVDKYETKGDKLILAEKITESLMFNQWSYKEKCEPAWKDGYIVGTSFILNKHFLRKRKVKVMKENAKKILESGNPNEVWKEEVKIDYDGTDYIPIPVENVVWNEMATDIGINTNPISELAWFQFISVEEAINQLKDNPFAKNLDKVTSSNLRENPEDVLFQPVKSWGEVKEQGVEVIWYFNTLDDRFVVLIGDQCCLDIPLPNNDKVIPFSKFTPFPVPYSPYGIGYAAKLRSIMTEEEIARDGYSDLLKINLNRRVFVEAMAFGEYVDGLTMGEMGTIIPVSDVNAMKWEDVPNLNLQQIAATRQMSRDDATIAAGIDPRNLGFSVRSSTATDAALNKEASTKLLALVLAQMKKAVKQSVMHTISNIKQYVAVPEKLVKNLEMKEIIRKHTVVPVDGIKITETDEGPVIEKIKGKTPVVVTKELFSFEPYEVDVLVEAMPELSKGLRMKKVEEMTAQLGPLMGKSDVPLMPGQPAPLIDIDLWYKMYLETHDVSTDLLINKDDTVQEAIRRALIQNKELEETGVEGIPGEPTQHLDVHRRQIEYYDRTIELMAQEGASLEELMVIMDARIRVVDHMAVDSQQPASIVDEAAQEAIGEQQEREGGMDMMQPGGQSTINPGEGMEDMMGELGGDMETTGLNGRPTAFDNPMQMGVGMPMEQGPMMRPQSEDMGGMLPPEGVGA